MVNPYGKYVTQGFSPAGLESPLGRKPDSSLRGMSPSLRAGGLSEPEAGAEPDPEGKEGLACLLPVCRSLGAGRKPRRRQGEIL